MIIIDPCLDTALVTSYPQTDPADYFYKTTAVPDLTWSLGPVFTTDYTCTIVYSCAVASSPASVDICNLIDATINAVFDPLGVTYVVSTADMVTYPPGDYTFEITGTVGSNSNSATFVATFVDPCPTTTLTINEPDPFSDQTYILRNAQIDQFWVIGSLIAQESHVDCGALTVEFFTDDAGVIGSLDPDLFLDDRTAFNLAVKSTQDTSKKGIYNLKYRAYHTLYPSNVVTLVDPFVITVIDPCDEPVSVTPSTQADQEYTITDTVKTY